MKDLLNTDYLRHNIHFPDAKYFENLAIVELSFVKFIMHHHHHYHHNDRMEWNWVGFRGKCQTAFVIFGFQFLCVP